MRVFWYWSTLFAIFLFSLILRFWNLGQFNELVFDEVYYAKFANDYLTNTHFFNSHPPLSQYIIALGISLGSFFDAPSEMVNNLTGSMRSTLSYRWINALSGSFIPLLVAALAFKMTLRRSYSIIAAFLISLDGIFLVESRYALNNIYIVIFGLLGNLFFLIYLSRRSLAIKHLILSGVFFGAAACIKWNGLWFFLGVCLMIVLGFLASFWQYPREIKKPEKLLQKVIFENYSSVFSKYPLDNLTLINPLYHLLILTVIGIITYSILWIPHLIMNPEYDFWEMQYQILTYHENIKSGPAVHPYCSTWYSWILMLRPIAYYYKQSNHIIHDVHSMANPIALWLSTLAVFSLLLWLLLGKKGLFSPNNWIITYIVINYLANLLPWIKVTRCIFFYHYIEAYTFSLLALAWFIDGWLSSSKIVFKFAGVLALISITLAFIFWLPIFMGSSLSQDEFNLRMFLQSWI